MIRFVGFALAAIGLLAGCAAHTAHLWIDRDRYDYEMAEPEHYQLPPELSVVLIAPEVLHGDPFFYPEPHLVSFRPLPMFRQVVSGSVSGWRDADEPPERLEITLRGFGFAIVLDKLRRSGKVRIDFTVRGYRDGVVCMSYERRPSDWYFSDVESFVLARDAPHSTELYRRAIHRAFAEITRDAVRQYERECRGESTG